MILLHQGDDKQYVISVLFDTRRKKERWYFPFCYTWKYIYDCMWHFDMNNPSAIYLFLFNFIMFKAFSYIYSICLFYVWNVLVKKCIIDELSELAFSVFSWHYNKSSCSIDLTKKTWDFEHSAWNTRTI